MISTVICVMLVVEHTIHECFVYFDRKCLNALPVFVTFITPSVAFLFSPRNIYVSNTIS